MTSSSFPVEPEGFIVLYQASSRQVAHQAREAEIPARTFMRVSHAIDQTSELVGAHRDDVAGLVGEAFAGRIAVGDRRVHRAEKERRAVGIIVMLADELRSEVGGIAADLPHRGAALQPEAVVAFDFERY